jgi:iron-sulfur cluster assembly protein
MLQVTEAAAAVVESTREQVGAPEGTGVRIQLTQTDDGQEGIGLAFREGPEQGDEVTEQAGIRVFVQSDLTDTLSEATLDARATDEGTELVVRQQE